MSIEYKFQISFEIGNSNEGRMKKSEETTKKILDAVTELLKTNDNITIKDICDKAYINIAAVNYHFGDKDTLINMAVQNIIDDLKKQIAQLANKEFKDTTEALYFFMDLIYKFASEYSGAIRYMLNSCTPSQGSNILAQLFSDKKFTGFILGKIKEQSPADDEAKLMSKYMMILSAFIFPMVCQYAFADDGDFSIKNEEFKKEYINQILKIFTD